MRSPYFKDSFHFDLVAGISVAIVALPLALGFGITTGSGAASGLATAIVAGFLAAVLGGSRYQVSGPTGAMTVVLVPIVAQYGLSSLLYLGVAAGALIVLLGLLHLGRFVERVPWMVMEGFTLGIAIIIALQQLPLIFNVSKPHGSETLLVAFKTVQQAFSHDIAWSNISIAAATVLIKITWTKFRHLNEVTAKIPGSAIAVISMSLLVHVLSIDVPSIGDIPNPFTTHISFSWPGIPVSGFTYAAFSIAALGAIESLLSARVADSMAHRMYQTQDKHDPNRELIGQGIATIGSALVGGLPATGAIARTSVNVHAGARTKWSSAIHSIALLLMALVFGHIVGEIPVAVIAGVLVGTSLRIANPTSVREYLQTTNIERITYVATAISVVAIDLIWGTIIGICVHELLRKYSKHE
ncbi:MAG: hypothetical protein RL410_389 [Actinomycetota bacterium]|jgi:SulP family sulfate permease